MKQLLVLGIRHKLQCGCGPFVETDFEAFRKFVRNATREHGLRLIAEEMSPDGLANYGVRETLCKSLEPELAIPVEFVDLDDTTRDRLKISQRQLQSTTMLASDLEYARTRNGLYEKHLSDPIRECAWLAHLIFRNIWPTLLIVGLDHVDGVALRARDLGLGVEVLVYEP